MAKIGNKTLKEIFSERKKVSINFKLAVAIIVAGVVAIGAFLLLGLIEGRIVKGIEDSKTIKEKAVNERFIDFEEFIKQNNITGDDGDAMQEWVSRQAYTELVVSDRANDIFTGGSTPAVASESMDKKVDLSKAPQDVFNREMRFLDKNYYVYIDVYMEYRWKALLDNVKLLISALIFLMLVLLYNRRVLNRIIHLSEEVNLISAGELDRNISAGEDDEIGALANDVDRMRTAIVDNMNKEKAAWDANTQLITSMSHDIRTPLTSLIGYLDIIAGHKYKNEEELSKYIDSCSDKAVQLKDLSDKLFQYFLVYNNKPKERELETLDGGILFQQFMIEHISELTQYDYVVDLQNNIPEKVMINTETSAMQRLFDNLFSNIMKYADSNHPIEIKADADDSKITILIKNHVSEVAKKVESTKIGVKTCKKIVEDLNGTFHALEDESIYMTEIFFPIKEIRPADRDDAPDEDGAILDEEMAVRDEAVKAEQESEKEAALQEVGAVVAAMSETPNADKVLSNSEVAKELDDYLPEPGEDTPSIVDAIEATREIKSLDDNEAGAENDDKSK